jgi:hypothetical protein
MTKKSKQKIVIKNKNQEEDKLLDYYIKQNLNTKSNTESKIEIKEDSNKQQLKLKLKNAIQLKNNAKQSETKHVYKKAADDFKEMIKNPKINTKMLVLYGTALTSNLNIYIPKPIEIIDNKEHYLKVYYQYILKLLNIIKEKQLNLKSLDKLLDNPYCHYMSNCLDCPLNPFTK